MFTKKVIKERAKWLADNGAEIFDPSSSEFPGCCGFNVLHGFEDIQDIVALANDVRSIGHGIHRKLRETFLKEDFTVEEIEPFLVDRLVGLAHSNNTLVALTAIQAKEWDDLLKKAGFVICIAGVANPNTNNKLNLYHRAEVTKPVKVKRK